MRLSPEIVAGMQQLALGAASAARTAYCMTEPACALYQSLGFDIHASLVEYSRPGTEA